MADLLRVNPRRLLLAGASAAAAVLLAHLLAHGRGDDDLGNAAAPPRAGQWFAPLARHAPEAAMRLPQPAARIDEKELLKLLDGYLVEQARTGGPARLKEALEQRFSGPALEQATRIAASYQRYIDAHDALLAAQGFGDTVGAADVARLRIWAQQRERLRESILGSALARAWYGDEAVSVKQVLDELEQQATQAPPGSDPRTAISAGVKRREALRHEAELRAVLGELTRSFASGAS